MKETALIIGFILLLAIVGVVGDYFVKLSGTGNKYLETKWLIIGGSIYGLSALGWFIVMKHMKLASLGMINAIFTIILVAVVVLIFFKEKLNIKELIGLLMGLISMVLLSKFA